jgi:streptogramin lyase
LIAIWGSQSSGPIAFGHPNGVTIGPNGHAFIADQINTRVVEVTAEGTYVTQYGAPAAHTLNGPSKVLADR